MPEMNGAELTALLRSAYPQLSILLMSGLGEAVFETAGPRPEDTHFIEKPFTPEQLAECVRKVLDSDRP
jgi:FixJ family two-component response regulator